MNKLTFSVFAALPILSGCDVFTETKYVDRVPVTESATMPSQIYSAAFTDDGETMMIEHLLGAGLTGFVGNSDGTVSEVRVRFDEAEELVYVAIDGGEEIVYDDLLDDGEDWIEIANAAGQEAYLYYSEGEPASINLWASESYGHSDGYFGVETAAAALPKESASYSGGWNASGSTGTTEAYAGGFINTAIDFETGELVGYSEGGFEMWNDETEAFSYGSLLAVISGSVEGSRLAATMDVFGDVSGTMDMMGAIYGEEGQYAAGGIGGSLTSEAGEMNLGGDFFLSGGEGRRPCFEC